MKNRNEAIDFLIFCYFGNKGISVDAIINRAYIDMASHTLKNFDDVNEKWNCRWQASSTIKKALQNIGEPYEKWHEKLCADIISKYPQDYLSYGQAQKWINMTVKYIYILKNLGKFQAEFPYISEENVCRFHVPIDSYILENVLEDKKTVWSKMKKDEYQSIRRRLLEREFDFIKELHEWNEVVETNKKYDKDSYGYFSKNIDSQNSKQ